VVEPIVELIDAARENSSQQIVVVPATPWPDKQYRHDSSILSSGS
jgi:hypothetical protein